MATTDVPEAPAPAPATDRPRVRRRWAAAVVVVIAALIAGWWWASTPRLARSGFSSVRSDDHQIVRVDGPNTSLYVVPADGDGETTLAFELINEGRLPLRILDVWPAEPEPNCFWTPTSREFRDEHATPYTDENEAVPATGATLPGGGRGTVWVTGEAPDRPACGYEDGAWASTDVVSVSVSIAGRASTVKVPLGYAFGISDDPIAATTQYGVSVIEPRE